MKYLLSKLIPGVAACLAVCLAIGMIRAQSNSEPVATPTPAPAANPPRLEQTPHVVHQHHAPAVQAAPVIVCGGCGEHVAQPQPVMIAMPLNPGRRVFVPQSGPTSTRGEYAAAAVNYPAPGYLDPYYRQVVPVQNTDWQVSPYLIPPSYPRYPRHGHHHGRACGDGCRY